MKKLIAKIKAEISEVIEKLDKENAFQYDPTFDALFYDHGHYIGW